MSDHYTVRCGLCQFPVTQCECKAEEKATHMRVGEARAHRGPLADVRARAKRDCVPAVEELTPILAHQLLYQAWNRLRCDGDKLGALARLDVVLSALARADLPLVFSAQRAAMPIMEPENGGERQRERSS